MTLTELAAAHEAALSRYQDARGELFSALVEFAALHAVLESRGGAAGGFAGDINELGRKLSHTAAPSEKRHLSTEINGRIAALSAALDA
jgi:hypothetical protein